MTRDMIIRELFLAAENTSRAVSESITSNHSIVETACDGDMETQADMLAESTIRETLQRFATPCQIMTEHVGRWETFGGAPQEWRAFVDPIDGSRPARFGQSLQTVPTTCLAGFKRSEKPTPTNIEFAIMKPLLGDTTVATVAKGAIKSIWGESVIRPIQEPANTIQDAIILNEHMGGCGVLEGIYRQPFAANNIGGHLLVCASSFAARMLVLGKCDLYLHLGPRLHQQWPELQAEIGAGGGKLPGLKAWDLAPFWRMVTEAGCTVTDAFGHSLADVELTPTATYSVIAARTPELHQQALDAINTAEAKALKLKVKILDLTQSLT